MTVKKKGEGPTGPSPANQSAPMFLRVRVYFCGVLDVTIRHTALRISGMLPLPGIVRELVAGPVCSLILYLIFQGLGAVHGLFQCGFTGCRGGFFRVVR